MPVVLNLREDDPQDITESIKDELDWVRTELLRLNDGKEEQVEELRTNSLELAERSSELQVVYERYSAAAQELRARLSALENRERLRGEEWRAINRVLSTQSESLRRLETELRATEERALKIREAVELPDRVWRRRVEMLQDLLPLFDPDQPEIVLEDTLSATTLKWRTAPLYLRDGFGGVLPFSFGQFDIEVKLEKGTMRYLRVECQRYLPGDLETSRHPHPHIVGVDPCLGNAQALMTTAFNELDYLKVPVIMAEYLTAYNFESPYNPLKAWGIPNQWEYLVCSSGQHVLFDCDCSRCHTCGALTPPEELYDCGACSTCCWTRHLYEPEADRRRSGINGTGCTPNRAPREIYRVKLNPPVVEQENDDGESDGQESADVHEDGVGQDVGADPQVPD